MKKEIKSLSEVEAKELIKNNISEISCLMDKIDEIRKDIIDIKKELKNKGINVSAFNLALRRSRKLEEGKSDLENIISDSDLYLSAIKV